jgi:putative nucleotidyltransferase with HDIG domain
MGILGKSNADKHTGDEKHLRTNYMDPSGKFAAWVNSLGLEKSWFGALFIKLESRFGFRRVAILFLFCLGLSFIIHLDFSMPQLLRVGEVPEADIKSPINLQMIDEVSTEAKRLEAERSQPLIFDYEPMALEAVQSRIMRTFMQYRNRIKAIKWPRSEDAQMDIVADFFKSYGAFSKELGVEVPDVIYEWLVRERFSTRIENILREAVIRWSSELIADYSDSSVRDLDQAVVIRELGDAYTRREFNRKLSDIKNLRDPSLFKLDGIKNYRQFPKRDQERLTRLAQLLLVPNVTLNKQEMNTRLAKARDSVLPVRISVNKNQTILSAGNSAQPSQVMIVSEIRKQLSSQRTDFMALFSAILISFVALLLFAFLHRFSRNKVHVEAKDIWVMGIITLIIVVFSKVLIFLTETALVERYGQIIPPSAFLYLAPYAAGAMLVALLITSIEVVWVYVIFSTVVMAITTDFNVGIMVVSLVGGMAGARGVFSCGHRNEIYRAGLETGVVTAIGIGLIFLLEHVGDDVVLQPMLVNMGAGLISGILSSLLALMVAPLLESVFNYTTDIKLLELSSLNNPIMQELMIKAPGTYQHCIAVGTMVDAAARDIGANPLLAKVMAYYHDIGKMEHAQYFIENQRPGYNPHDYISPHMSKTILVAHVKDGAEMALKHRLGKPIVDGILQHHGTTLISYFYNKALGDQDEDVTGVVEESDFRYPGPKPQFKEAALCMLADSIEATARSLDEPTAGRLNAIVENIIESKFMDGQLNECNLTISELSIIKDSFKRMLLSIYHQRMEYPHMRDGKLLSVKSQNKKALKST